ncbi:CotH kinase family protein [soil metagenome]
MLELKHFMKYKYFLIILIFTQSCYKEDFDPHYKNLIKRNELTSFSLEVQNNPSRIREDVNFTIEHNKITAFIPYYLQKDSLVATFTTNGENVYLNDILQISGETINDFTKPVTYIVEAKDGTRQGYILDLVIFTKLPILHINTKDKQAKITKEDYIEGEFLLDPNDIHEYHHSGELGIRGRGNSTWLMPKRPYRLKLAKNIGMLRMPADKDWVLLANYSDKTLMRNSLAFEMSKRFKLSFTPKSRFIELFVNGEYQGNYLLAEQIKVADERVNIKSLEFEDISENKISGGYLLEVNVRVDADYYFHTLQKNVAFTIKSPGNIVPEQLEYIENFINQVENSIYSEDFSDPELGYRKFINVESFINWFLVNEIAKNNDAFFVNSVFFYKNRGEKLNMGPVWDFDIALGNIYYNGNDKPEGWWVKNCRWFEKLFEDPNFTRRLKNRWNELKHEEIDTLPEYIEKISTELEYSQKYNFERWDILNKNVWPNTVVIGSYKGEVQYLKEWLEKRINWMDAQINANF